MSLVPTTDLSAVRWIHGAPDCDQSTDPPIQVVAYEDDTYVLRQGKCVNFEAPFLYLLFGREAVLLHDTGATADAGEFPIRRTVDELIAGRQRARGGGALRLIVTHSHGHGDHRMGDVQFADLPAGSVAPIGEDGVAAFFGIADWPAGRSVVDLGDRVIDVLPAPGHLADHVLLFDQTRGLLLTGDTLLTGTLTVRDWTAFRETIRRAADFCRESARGDHPVRQVLGAHIEMTDRPGELYELGTTYQPDERPLPLTVGDVFALEVALGSAREAPRTIPGDRFIVEPMEGA